MIIEFLGLPATGKSSLARKYIELQKKNNVNIEYPLEKLYKKSWYIRNIQKISSFVEYTLSNMKHSILVLNTIINLKQESWKDIVKMYFNYIFLVSQYDRYSKIVDEIYIFDEGIVHTIWAITFKAKKQITKKDIEILLGNIKLPKDIIKVEAEEYLIEKRLYARKSGTRLEREDDVKSAIKKSKENINNILKVIENDLEYKFNIIEVRNNNEKDLKNGARLIEEKIKFKMN